MLASLQTIAEHLLLPPGLGIALTVLGVLLWRADWRGGRPLLALGLLALVLPSLQVVAQPLADTLEREVRDSVLATGRADAIVILGGGRWVGRAEDAGHDALNPRTHERVREGARLHRATDLPIVVSGGVPRALPGRRSEAELMAATLQQDLGVSARWLENTSRNTCENATHTRQRLQGQGVDTVLVVTQAMHLPRALECFERAGFDAYPAPAGFRGATGDPRGLGIFLPTVEAIETSRFALREWLARAALPLRERLRGSSGD
ncbi:MULTISPECIES: YdcF family protein [unclassified Thioalkalivibrio]|uniref:YdcF family protein n=1 Tax=unclassified Thioalkalivibrio TaxID=2621013 RepID=UPI00037F5CC7|nr:MULTISPECIES: YdcF family protein [unclassified Thioalkalivibrio]